MNNKIKNLNKKIDILENKLKEKKIKDKQNKNEEKYKLIKLSILSGNNNKHLLKNLKNLKK